MQSEDLTVCRAQACFDSALETYPRFAFTLNFDESNENNPQFETAMLKLQYNQAVTLSYTKKKMHFSH